MGIELERRELRELAGSLSCGIGVESITYPHFREKS